MKLTTLPYDRAKVLENFGGDEELLGEVATLFIAAWPENLARLRAALAAADAAALRSAAHAVKGSVANFCADRAVQAARLLEMTGKGGDLTQAAAQFEVVVATVEEVIAALGPQPERRASIR